LPDWDALHPLIIHFPIALLLVAPLIILTGIFLPAKGRTYFFITAFILLALGTVACFVAVSTGSAAGELAERIANAEGVLEQHEELAQTSTAIFSALTAVFGAIVFIPLLFKKELSRTINAVLSLAFLIFYVSGVVVLINTAHQGGMLVHRFGVHAMVASSTNNSTLPYKREHKDDD
jgi:uncharacterized membrane protein